MGPIERIATQIYILLMFGVMLAGVVCALFTVCLIGIWIIDATIK